MPDFSALLDKQVDDAKRPVLLPPGNYEGVIVKWAPEDRNYKEGEKTDVICFTVRLTAPCEDVDMSEVREEDGSPVDLSKRILRADFPVEQEQLYRLGEFIQTLGIETRRRSFKETLPETPNCPVIVSVIQKPNKKVQGEFFNNVSKIIGTHEKPA